MQPRERPQALETWIAEILGRLALTAEGRARPLTAEASSRRFARIFTNDGPLIVMDAPPASENNQQYVMLGQWLRRHGLRAPEVYAADLERGFLLIEDFGDVLLGHRLARAGATERRDLYRCAIRTLVRFQRAAADDPPAMPDYDAARLGRELGLFSHWFVDRLLGLRPPPGVLDTTERALTAAALEQPRGGVYLDYHSRNLLLLTDGELGLVDFQDAHTGPVSYDLVSLLRDCYLRWPEAEVRALRDDYLEAARAADLEGVGDAAAFARGFDLCGIQRHMKALGIFARVYLDGGRDTFLADMPRVMAHLAAVMPAHPETRALGDWLADTAGPRLSAVLAPIEARADVPADRAAP